MQRVNEKLRIAPEELSFKFMKKLKEVEEKISNRALKEIHPLYIATHLSE